MGRRNVSSPVTGNDINPSRGAEDDALLRSEQGAQTSALSLARDPEQSGRNTGTKAPETVSRHPRMLCNSRENPDATKLLP